MADPRLPEIRCGRCQDMGEIAYHTERGAWWFVACPPEQHVKPPAEPLWLIERDENGTPVRMWWNGRRAAALEAEESARHYHGGEVCHGESCIGDAQKQEE